VIVTTRGSRNIEFLQDFCHKIVVNTCDDVTKDNQEQICRHTEPLTSLNGADNFAECADHDISVTMAIQFHVLLSL